MVHFVGAGPGAPDLLTLRGAALLEQAGCIIYAGSLVNPALLARARDGCAIYNSAGMTLEQVLDAIRRAEAAGVDTVRLHTGDPCVYGAIREQMDALDALGIPWDDTPGVSSFCGAAAALGAEYTLPGVSQTVIITRLAGRTPVPERESLAALAAHRASMVIFLSAGVLGRGPAAANPARGQRAALGLRRRAEGGRRGVRERKSPPVPPRRSPGSLAQPLSGAGAGLCHGGRGRRQDPSGGPAGPGRDSRGGGGAPPRAVPGEGSGGAR